MSEGLKPPSSLNYGSWSFETCLACFFPTPTLDQRCSPLDGRRYGTLAKSVHEEPWQKTCKSSVEPRRHLKLFTRKKDGFLWDLPLAKPIDIDLDFPNRMVFYFAIGESTKTRESTENITSYSPQISKSMVEVPGERRPSWLSHAVPGWVRSALRPSLRRRRALVRLKGTASGPEIREEIEAMARSGG